MKQEHKYAQVLRWIADGELNRVELMAPYDQTWRKLTKVLSNDGLAEVLLGKEMRGYAFRLAPRTITINGREIVAPLTVVPKLGTPYYVFSSTGVAELVWNDTHYDILRLMNGYAFASPGAAQAAHAVISSLMTGKGN